MLFCHIAPLYNNQYQLYNNVNGQNDTMGHFTFWISPFAKRNHYL